MGFPGPHRQKWCVGLHRVRRTAGHLVLLRHLCVDDRPWMEAREIEDGIATTNLLPGPASTQLAIFCAWRLRGWPGATSAACASSSRVWSSSSPFLPSSCRRTRRPGPSGRRPAPEPPSRPWRCTPRGDWSRPAGSASAPTQPAARWPVRTGGAVRRPRRALLVLVLLGCGVIEIIIRRPGRPCQAAGRSSLPASLHGARLGGLGALAWVALKVGALSYGGGFIIIPLMQHDAVRTYHWMTGAQFLNAVALGQITPGPVVQTVAVVGYAAGGIGGGLFAAGSPSPLPLPSSWWAGRASTDTANASVESFLTGAAPAVSGPSPDRPFRSACPCSNGGRYRCWPGVAIWLFVIKHGVVAALLLAGAAGIVLALAGLPV